MDCASVRRTVRSAGGKCQADGKCRADGNRPHANTVAHSSTASTTTVNGVPNRT